MQRRVFDCGSRWNDFLFVQSHVVETVLIFLTGRKLWTVLVRLI